MYCDLAFNGEWAKALLEEQKAEERWKSARLHKEGKVEMA
jgi:hypothetical protein